MAGFSEVLEARNEKIIRGIIRRAERVCPGSLALIGIYGSFSTGRIHPGSDLDLLILINDEAGYRLKAAFVQEDLEIGHDLYCTRWEDLERMAGYPDPHISKLMDSRIVYVSAPEYAERLQALRSRARRSRTSSGLPADTTPSISPGRSSGRRGMAANSSMISFVPSRK